MSICTYENIEYHENNSLKIKYSYIKIDSNNIKDGIYEEWYANGKKKEESIYLNGNYNGLCKKWYENGDLHIEFTYANSKHWGMHNETVNNFVRKIYEKNILYYDNGNKKEEYILRNGGEGFQDACGQRRDMNVKATRDYYKSWYENGQMKEDVVPHLYTSWHENGNKEKEYYTPSNGIKQGPYSEWHYNGSLKIKCVYIGDKLDGLYEERYPCGQIYKYCQYKNGVIKTSQIYDEFGNLIEYK